MVGSAGGSCARGPAGGPQSSTCRTEDGISGAASLRHAQRACWSGSSLSLRRSCNASACSARRERGVKRCATPPALGPRPQQRRHDCSEVIQLIWPDEAKPDLGSLMDGLPVITVLRNSSRIDPGSWTGLDIFARSSLIFERQGSLAFNELDCGSNSWVMAVGSPSSAEGITQ